MKQVLLEFIEEAKLFWDGFNSIQKTAITLWLLAIVTSLVFVALSLD